MGETYVDRSRLLYSLVDGSRHANAVLASELVKLMRDALPSQSKESVMETFGISSNTWLKIKRGEPIRQSTAECLVRRLGRSPLAPHLSASRPEARSRAVGSASL